MEELKKKSARCKIAAELGPGRTPNVMEARNLPLGSLESIFTTRLNKWDGPFHVIDIAGNTITLLLRFLEDPSQLRSTSVRLYVPMEPLPMSPTLELDGEILAPS